MRFYTFVVLIVLVLLPGVTALSFSSGPEVYFPGTNVTTTDDLNCRFTPSGSGSLSVNVTWFLNNSAYTESDVVEVSVTDGVESTLTIVDSLNTAKYQEWICSVILYNETTSLVQNSSSVPIQNTRPDISTPAQLVYYEDTPASFTFSASDDDGDTITWSSLDLDRGSFGNNELFIIESDGDVFINETDESLVGNHTMQISAFDEGIGPGSEGSTLILEFELVAVNDAPIFSLPSLNYSCTEGQVCSGTVIANDEDNESNELTYTFNESYVNGSSSGVFSFTPTFVQANQGNLSIEVNVSDGQASVLGLLNISIISVNNPPNVSFNNVSGTQNDTLFTFFINATDPFDPQDVFNFTIASTNPLCVNDPWTIENYTNGTGGSVAQGLVNTSLFSNDYVACRNVTITVHEYDTSTDSPKGTYDYDVFFNISNINDAPVLHELNSNESQQNMSNLTAALGLSFSYTVNATDVDQLTYEGDTLSYSLGDDVPLFAGGDPMFTINATSGEVSAVQEEMNDSYQDVFNFTVFVFDSLVPQYNDSRVLSVNISVNIPPIITAKDNATCFDNATCTKIFTGEDFESSELSLLLNQLTILNPLNSLTTYSDTETIATLLGINTTGVFAGNQTNFTLNFTPDDSDRGNYSLNFSVQDTVGNIVSSILNFTVNNTPEPPQFDNTSNPESIVEVSFGTIIETLEYYQEIYLRDDDLVFASDNLTFSYEFVSDTSPSGMVLTQINNSLVVLNYTPDANQNGSYAVNITLNDTYNFSITETINFDIFDISEFPIINQARPFFNLTQNDTVTGFNTLSVDQNITNVSFEENTTVVFDVRAFDKDNLSMNVTWYVNGTQNVSFDYNASSPDHDYTRNFTFFDRGVFNITVVVEDIGFDSFTWLVNITDANRPPQFVNDARNLTGGSAVQGTVLFNNFFFINWDENIVFYDPDDDENNNGEIDLDQNETNTLEFAVNTSGNCDELAIFTFQNDTDDLVIDPATTGVCTTRFIATDPSGASVNSNEITIQIIQTSTSTSSTSSSSSRTRTVTETVTVPVEEPVDVPVEVDIIFPDVAVTYANNTAVVPIRITNNWDETLTGITLGLNDSLGVLSYSYTQDLISVLPRDQSIDVNLTLSGYRANEPFSFNVTAFIGSLQYTDYETIHINSLERGQEDLNSIISRLSFARDLLRDNPECGELLEVLEAAENNPESTSFEIINNVINACKYLISDGVSRNDSFPKSFSGKLSVYGKTILDYNLLYVVLGGLAGAALIVGLVVRFGMKKI